MRPLCVLLLKPSNTVWLWKCTNLQKYKLLHILRGSVRSVCVCLKSQTYSMCWFIIYIFLKFNNHINCIAIVLSSWSVSATRSFTKLPNINCQNVQLNKTKSFSELMIRMRPGMQCVAFSVCVYNRDPPGLGWKRGHKMSIWKSAEERKKGISFSFWVV